MTCQHCGATLTPTTKDPRPRRYCGRDCFHAADRARKTLRRTALIEDLEWIIDVDHPERVARRLGFASPENLSRKLYVWGRPDLAQRMQVAS